MLLEELKGGTHAFLHMERYVNQGSPSGFSDKYSTSEETNASGPRDYFHLCGIEVPSETLVADYGQKTDFFCPWQMLVHPDMIEDRLFSNCSSIHRDALRVSPTSSSRTVLMLDREGYFLKLCYKGLIGRVERHLSSAHAISAVEVSGALSDALDSGVLGEGFYFLRESFARVVYLPDGENAYEWGIVLREPKPYPRDPAIEYLIPAFSLFSTDIKKPSDPTLLTQIYRRQNKPLKQFLFEDVIAPVYNAYFNVLEGCGLQLEAHAQNMLYAMDKAGRLAGVVARDAESIDKDYSLMSERSIKNNFTNTGYKTLIRGQANYHIMHSFMFDFKLGEYLVGPIIQHAHSIDSFDARSLLDDIKTYNRSRIDNLPGDFFPTDKCWYSYANIVHDRSKPRPYIATPNPRYR